ncbi:fibronectin type III domain-containing protein [Candidatus Poriferisocius sp.]|uniref:fibronectin type III domain-containing protein n=1 Tax=Candidatus Poriferisocius sp. TaxID=3101276 RepID=UPI003B0221F1
MRPVVSLVAAVAMVAVVLASGSVAAQGSQGSGQQAASDGRELLMPACAAGGGQAPEAGTIKFAMCPDHLTIQSATTASDITFYPAFSPDRHDYVVHVADGVSEVRLKMRQFSWPLFTRGSEGPKLWPGWTYVSVEADDARTPSSPGNLPVLGSNNGHTRDVLVRLSPGVNTVQIVPSQWFKRFGPTQSESSGWSWVKYSDKQARKVYTLELVWQSPDTPLVAPAELTPIGTVDYDADDDGLVEVSSLAQLDAVRWDANGDGYSDHGGPLHVGFPNALAQMGCPTSGCVGYELAADLDFDTNASGGADDGDDYWNGGHGWVPIGASTLHYSGVFEGNGHVISNLFIDSNRDTQSLATEYAKVESWTTDKSLRSIHLGLFEELAGGGAIRNVGLADASVARNFTCLSSQRYRCADGFVGGLAGVSAGAISGSWVSGAVSNTITNGADSRMSQAAVAGGLVGYAHGSSVIAASYSAASVVANHTPKSSVGSQVGGLVGANDGTIFAAYATGAVQSNLDTSLSLAGHLLGGLVGRNGGTITASYSTGAVPEGFERSGLVGHNAGRVIDSYWDTTASGTLLSAAGTAKTTAELQAPTDYTGIYANWNVDLDGDGSANDPWDFGTSSDYPTLTGVGPGSHQQVGSGADQQKQKRQPQASGDVPGPVTALALTATSNTVMVSWQPPDTGGAPTRYIVHLRPEGGKKGSGKTKNPKAKKTEVTFKNLKPGTTYNVWVRAQNQHGKGDRLSDTITLPL